MHIFQLKSNDMLYKIEPVWILLLEHIAVYCLLRLRQHSRYMLTVPICWYGHSKICRMNKNS